MEDAVNRHMLYNALSILDLADDFFKRHPQILGDEFQSIQTLKDRLKGRIDASYAIMPMAAD